MGYYLIVYLVPLKNHRVHTIGYRVMDISAYFFLISIKIMLEVSRETVLPSKMFLMNGGCCHNKTTMTIE